MIHICQGVFPHCSVALPCIILHLHWRHSYDAGIPPWAETTRTSEAQRAMKFPRFAKVKATLFEWFECGLQAWQHSFQYRMQKSHEVRLLLNIFNSWVKSSIFWPTGNLMGVIMGGPFWHGVVSDNHIKLYQTLWWDVYFVCWIYFVVCCM